MKTERKGNETLSEAMEAAQRRRRRRSRENSKKEDERRRKVINIRDKRTNKL